MFAPGTRVRTSFGLARVVRSTPHGLLVALVGRDDALEGLEVEVPDASVIADAALEAPALAPGQQTAPTTPAPPTEALATSQFEPVIPPASPEAPAAVASALVSPSVAAPTTTTDSHSLAAEPEVIGAPHLPGNIEALLAVEAHDAPQVPLVPERGEITHGGEVAVLRDARLAAKQQNPAGGGGVGAAQE